MRTHSKALLAGKDMDGRQHSATGVLPCPFHIKWVSKRSGLQMAALLQPLLPTLLPADLAQAKMLTRTKAHLASRDMMDGRQHSASGVLVYPFHSQMGLHKLWVANGSPASTLATRFTTVAASRLRSGLSQNVDPFQDAPGQ